MCFPCTNTHTANIHTCVANLPVAVEVKVKQLRADNSVVDHCAWLQVLQATPRLCQSTGVEEAQEVALLYDHVHDAGPIVCRQL